MADLKKLLQGLGPGQAQSLLRLNPHLAGELGQKTAAPPGPRSEEPGRVEVRINVRLVAEVNDRRGWAARARRAKAQREAVRAALSGHRVPAGPRWTVTITRESPGLPDDDNVTGSAKHVRDAIGAWLGTGDAPTAPVRWVTQHAQTKRGHSVLVVIETDEGDRP